MPDSLTVDPSHKVSRWKLTTPKLWFCILVYCWGDVLFGFDTGMFGGLQALPSFKNEFGQIQPDGTKGFDSQHKSIMNSIVWIGKISGTLSTDFVLQKIGYKKLMYTVVFFQCLAVIIELTAKSWVQYGIGRIFAYFAVGLAETAVPSYCSELAPVPLRGFFAASINWFLGFGSILGSVLNRVYATHTGREGWMVPTAVQLIPAFMLGIGVPFTVRTMTIEPVLLTRHEAEFAPIESPRWLLEHNRKEEALASLNQFRPKEDVDSGNTVLELEALEQATEEAAFLGKGKWVEIFRSTYFRRSMIAIWMFFFQQCTGNQFLNLYGPTFYVSMGLGAKSFTYSLVGNAPQLVIGLLALFLYDIVGKRPVMMVGSFLQVPFLIVVAVVGSKANPSHSDINAMVASFIIFGVWAKVALTQPCYAIASEIGGTRMRKKIMSLATSWDVIWAFTVSYSTPYLLGSPGADLGAKVGYIFAGVSFASFIFITFFVPEMKGRSLEEIDEMFERRLWAWQFSKIKTTGVGARIAVLEGTDRQGLQDPRKLGAETVHAENPDYKTARASLEELPTV